MSQPVPQSSSIEPVPHADPRPPAAPRRFDTAFIVVAAILLIAAIGLNGTVQRLQLTFRKQPVELRKPLKEIAPDFGPWRQISIDERLNHEIEDALAAKEYIFRIYVNTAGMNPAEAERLIARFEGKSADERAKMAKAIHTQFPDRVMEMAVTYYTGLVDTVAHIPDRCYIADGFEPTEYEIKKWSCFDSRGDNRAAARFITFEDQVPGRRAESRNVGYFFQVNGRYTNDPLDVRATLQDLRERYGYYAKIELKTELNDRAVAARVMNDFLTYALPEVEKALPDWPALKAAAR